jgi:EAL domain-containing protein (putative c-di-GMP-specific phosphodiesterase class I)
VLKIDKSFVQNLGTNDEDDAIVRSTIDLAHNLKLLVVAEGVESEEVLSRLVALGCDMAQGYCLSRPVPADQLTTWLQVPAAQRVTKPGGRRKPNAKSASLVA